MAGWILHSKPVNFVKNKIRNSRYSSNVMGISDFFSRFSRSFHGHHLLFHAQFTFFHGNDFAEKSSLSSPTWLQCGVLHTALNFNLAQIHFGLLHIGLHATLEVELLKDFGLNS